MHEIAWGWWLLMSVGVVTLVTVAMYSAILLVLTRRASGAEPVREPRATGESRGMAPSHSPHAPATT